MIEMVYNGKESDGQSEVRLPKNIRQIGENKSRKKVYVEDYVMTQLKKKPTNEESVKYGVLVGEIKKAKGNSYIFVKGMVEVKEIIENSLIFNDEIWEDIYKQIKRYFENLEIIGWFVSVPYRVKDDMSGLKKIHLDNFAGNDKVCFLSDRTEKEDGFYIFENGSLNRQGGYYIYYEKNEKMKRYLKESNGREIVAPNNIQSNNKSDNGKQNNQNKQNKTQPEQQNEKTPNNAQPSLREMIKNGKENLIKDSENADGPVKQNHLAYGISGVLIIALLLSTIVMLNNYGELKNIKTSLQNMNNNQNAQAVNKIIESMTTAVNGESKTNKETKAGTTVKDNEKSTNAVKSKDTSNTPTNKINTTSQNTTTSAASDETDGQKTGGQIYSGAYHTVLSGQTLYDISMKYYGTSQMVDEIKDLNGIDDDYKIIEGEKIKLP